MNGMLTIEDKLYIASLLRDTRQQFGEAFIAMSRSESPKVQRKFVGLSISLLELLAYNDDTTAQEGGEL